MVHWLRGNEAGCRVVRPTRVVRNGLVQVGRMVGSTCRMDHRHERPGEQGGAVGVMSINHGAGAGGVGSATEPGPTAVNVKVEQLVYADNQPKSQPENDA